MAKLTLDDIQAGYSSTTTINDNNALVETAVENTLSRDGTSPNQMGAQLDMNSYPIVNLPDAVNNQSPVTLAQAATLAGVTNPISAETVGAVLYPTTAAETSLAVTPTNYYYPTSDVRRYGATLDGTTNISAELQTALNVAGVAVTGTGYVQVPGDCALTAIVSFPSGASVILDFKGHKVNVDVSVRCLDIDSMGLGTNDPKHQIINGHFQSSTAGVGTAIRIQNSQQQVVKNCEFHDFDTAILLRIEGSSNFCESTVLSNLMIEGCDFGIYFRRASGNYSFASTQFDHILLTTANAQAATAYGIFIETDCDIYRSTFDQVVIFPAKTNSIGLHCNGKMRNVFGLISMEGNNGSATGNTAFNFGSSADLLACNLHLDIRGTIANEFVYTDAGDVLEGITTSHTSDPPAYLRRPATQTTVRSVFDDDLTTQHFSERMTSSDRLQWLVSATTPPEFKRLTDTSKLAGVRLLPVGNETPGAFTDGDATPTVDGNDFFVTANTGPTTITDFDDGIDGQTIWVKIGDANTTIDFSGTNLRGNAGVDWTPGSGDFMTCRYDGTFWLCQVTEI